ncbi:MAG: CoA-transferase [Chloroflexota bacterium]
MKNKFISAEEAALLVPNQATVATIGGGGGLVEADTLLAAVEARFLESGSPNDMTFIHSLGIGDRAHRGVNRFAHEGMIRRVIGGHWVWSPRMQALAKENKIEAYVLPGGVTAQLMREIGAGRPGLITHVGLGTFVDPRQDGGKMNSRAQDDLVELIELDGRTLLRYKPFPIDVALLRGSFADSDGNISIEQEAANLEIRALAMAAHNSGGKVIVQVRTAVERGTLPARSVHIPGAWVDAVVVDPTQPQSHEFFYDPTVSGERRGILPAPTPRPFTIREVVARRAAQELFDGAVINYGFGMPDAIPKILAEWGTHDRYYQTIEHGTYGGALLEGTQFGFAQNPTCMIDSPSQFDFYSGGGLDIAFLGFGEFDAQGNVNVSKLGGVTVGPGGFIDIAQNARKVVFCGSFEAKGAKYNIGDGRLQIDAYGEIPKAVERVSQITFSGEQAVATGQQVLYVTERAVFALDANGMTLLEVAPGVDPQQDVLQRMGFTPHVPAEIRVMPKECFYA